MRRKIINIDTDENKKEVFEKFNSVNSKHQAHILFGISDNKSGSEYLKDIAQQVGFDFEIYKQRKEKPKKYCLQCGKELTKQTQKSFCCRSCAITYNNHHSIKKEETRKKISESLKFFNKKIRGLKEKTNESREQIYKKIKKESIKYNCLQCGKEINKGKFCSNKCSTEYRKNIILQKWLKNEYIINGNCPLTKTIKEFLLKRNNYKCEECGFEGYNRKTGNTILQFHHKDGDSSNNSPENIQVLCPNCHAMTENYMALNKGHSARDKRFHL